MLKSMTAYGRAESAGPLGQILVEIHSVNRRFLDLRISLPKELHRFDVNLREWVSARVGRGTVTVSVSMKPAEEGMAPLKVNRPLVRALVEAGKQVAELTGKSEPSTEWILSQDGALIADFHTDETQLEEALKEVVDEALEQFEKMRAKEGEALFDDLGARLSQVRQWAHEVESVAPTTVEKYREKLLERIEQICEGEHDDRVLREVGLFAEKVDTAEELTRLKSHFDQVQELLQQGDRVGRPLDFLMQELVREVNTIGSKASEGVISNLVLRMKGEIERMREQVQNVE